MCVLTVSLFLSLSLDSVVFDDLIEHGLGVSPQLSGLFAHAGVVEDLGILAAQFGQERREPGAAAAVGIEECGLRQRLRSPHVTVQDGPGPPPEVGGPGPPTN